MIRAIVGGNWGDEGKGKITDLLAENADIVVRFQGGANAGHTIINEYGKNVLHTLPSGVFRKNTINCIATGAALDPGKLLAEIEMLEKNGVPTPKLLISARAQILLPLHTELDTLEEERLGKNSFGSTKSGIAPFYSDKYAKKGIQVSELYSTTLRERLERLYSEKLLIYNAMYNKKPTLSFDNLYKYVLDVRDKLSPFVCDVPHYLHGAAKEGKNILLEGQLGALRDPDNGIYPFVTSSSTLAGYASVSTGIPPHAINQITAVIKAYSTCVGAGAFVGELFGKEADELRERGGSDGEFGATTGRPRRMAWFDAVATRYGCMLQGSTDVALTMVDVLGYLDEIPVCVGYDIDGVEVRDMPVTPMLENAKPIYEIFEGWKCDVSEITSYDKLPSALKKYIEFIEDEIQAPISMISNGPNRDQIIYKK